jgi:hypothetical protein
MWFCYVHIFLSHLFWLALDSATYEYLANSILCQSQHQQVQVMPNAQVQRHIQTFRFGTRLTTWSGCILPMLNTLHCMVSSHSWRIVMEITFWQPQLILYVRSYCAAWLELLIRKLALLTWGKLTTSGAQLMNSLMENSYPLLSLPTTAGRLTTSLQCLTYLGGKITWMNLAIH